MVRLGGSTLKDFLPARSGGRVSVGRTNRFQGPTGRTYDDVRSLNRLGGTRPRLAGDPRRMVGLSHADPVLLQGDGSGRGFASLSVAPGMV